jgi:glycosyltransferase involved in cell wall biosynthesis
MAYLITKPANRIFVSTMAWEPLLKKFTAKKIECTPVFSSFICDVDHNAVQREREKILSGNTALLLGHFGAYGAISDSLLAKVFALLLKKPGRIALFIGKGSKEFLSDLEKENPFIHDKAIALGYVEAQAIPALLSACDILVQPYPDGVTTRRSSIVSGLALGKPIVTNIGPLTEKFWFDSRAVFLVNNNEASEIVDATEKLLSDPAEQREISEKAASLYKTVFSLNNTINKLRENQS